MDDMQYSISFLLLRVENRLIQKGYLQPIITQYFASNKSEIWP